MRKLCHFDNMLSDLEDCYLTPPELITAFKNIDSECIEDLDSLRLKIQNARHCQISWNFSM